MTPDTPQNNNTGSQQEGKTTPTTVDAADEYQLLQKVFEEQDTPEVLLDERDIIIQANKAFRSMVGDTVPEVLGQKINDLVVPSDRQEEGEQASRQVLAGTRLRGYITKRLIKGTISDVRINAYPVQTDKGIHIAVTYENITAELHQKKIQEALYNISSLAHEETSRTELYQKIHGIILELFPAKANNFYIALLNDEKTGISFPYYADEKDAPPKGDFPLQKGLTEYVLRTGKTLLANSDILQELEEKKEIVRVGSPSSDWLGVPLRSGDETIGVMVTQSYTQDIRYTDEEQKLFQFISDRIAEVIIKKKKEAQIQALEEENKEQEIMASIGRVAAGLAHIINNKLQAAQLHVQLLTKSDPSKRDEHTAIIQKSMNEMAQTIRQLRYFAHKATLVKKNVSLSSIIPRLLSSYPSLIVENQQTADMVVADAQALEEMIASLMNNAVMASHTAEGEEKRITMLLENISSLPPSIPTTTKKKMVQAPSWIHIVVSDTGVGIDPESMSTIFAPFAPIKPYAPIDGAVLGLASAQEIAKQHGGIIEAESTLGRGTKMHVYLPLKEEEIPRNPKKNNPVHEKNDIPLGNGECILVVEDETSLLQAIQEILESLGYTVITAQNGQQALEKIKEKKPDLILSDIVMPVMNGINLAQTLQKDFSSSQIIMMSGYSRKDDMDILEKIGVSQFIRKPFPIRTLALAVHNSIQSIQAEREQKKTE